MTISFKCKKCGKNYKVSDDKAGKKFKCRQCEAPVRIPELETDDFSEDWEEPEPEYEAPARRRKSSAPKNKSKSKGRKKTSPGSNQNKLIAGGAIALVLIGGGLLFLFSSSKPGGGLMKSITDKVDVVINSQLNKSGGNSGNGSAASDIDNMKKIGQAFHDFHDSFTRFPPADAHLVDGKPLLSWRVHMLPFLGQKELYQRFNLQEAWDSPHNSALLKEMPDIYQTEGVNQAGYTSIMTFSGEGTPFTGDKGPQMRKFTDGTGNVILCVQAGSDKAVPWTKPVDLPFNQANPVSVLGQTSRGAFLCIMADGSIRKIPAGIASQTLKNAIQHNDGNVTPLF
ncbi:DUF1559 family PulG-like putative transporter [Gimesia algae]|uniref:DUF1559 domain-containing protein n=1 Tax=Gimesia algae TaxID=2527971 RepID=A0A517VFJ7_9PLAN|nr:DUF1559 domain-containing protein [Gimesia algae]QDT91774.1 hypothetical protein Pan161_34370 [Gimesia algae]